MASFVYYLSTIIILLVREREEGGGCTVLNGMYDELVHLL